MVQLRKAKKAEKVARVTSHLDRDVNDPRVRRASRAKTTKE